METVLLTIVEADDTKNTTKINAVLIIFLDFSLTNKQKRFSQVTAANIIFQ